MKNIAFLGTNVVAIKRRRQEAVLEICMLLYLPDDDDL